MITTIRHILGVSLLAVALMLTSCSGDDSDLIAYIHEVKARPSKRIEPMPSFAPLSVFVFPENDNRRSPFKPIAQANRSDVNAPDQSRKKQPLEAFPLDALKFVGTLGQGSDLWALIKQPDMQITRIRVGNYIGQNFGKVILIKDNMIKIEETMKVSGAWKKETTTITLDTDK
jgi:type IV pilus assembly protein PilP